MQFLRNLEKSLNELQQPGVERRYLRSLNDSSNTVGLSNRAMNKLLDLLKLSKISILYVKYSISQNSCKKLMYKGTRAAPN